MKLELESFLLGVGIAEFVDALLWLDPESAVFVVNGDRDIVYWSPGAEQLTGIGAEQAEGQSCLQSQRCVRCLEGCSLERLDRIGGYPIEIYHASGERVAVRKYAWTFRDEDGAFAGSVERLVRDGRPLRSLGSGDMKEEFHGILTQDSGMRELFQSIRRVAETVSPVLVRGESGSGKELVARAVHAESSRSRGPFVAVNCAALSPSLMESELFGHVKGAFTGAVKERGGLFRQANGGSLFLDEIAELPLDMQAKLLRVLEEQRVTPVGGGFSVDVDVRLISATHRSLRAEVKAGRFREDLMYRLRVVPLFLPPLRERRGDVELLLWHWIGGLRGRRIERIEPGAMRALMDYGWPGNVRELRNVVQYAAAVGRGVELTLDELPPEFRSAVVPGTVVAGGVMKEQPSSKVDLVREALRQAGGRIGEAARIMGVSRSTFWRLRRRFEV